MLFSDLTPGIARTRTARLAPGVMLLALPDGPPDRPIHGFSPPFGTVSVRGAAGPHRIAAMRFQMDNGAGEGAFRGLPPETGPAVMVNGPDTLADELDAASCRRLLAFLLGFCRTAFGLAADPGFAATCTRLARRCVPIEGVAKPIARAGASWMVLSGVRSPEGATFYLLGPSRVRLSTAPAIGGNSSPHLIEPARTDELLLAMASEPLLWTIAPPVGTLPDLLGSPARSSIDPKVRSICLRALAGAGGRAAAVVRETQVLTPSRARRHDDPASPIGAALEAALPDGEGGLFLRGWLRDPLSLISALEIRTSLGSQSVDPSTLHAIHRPDLTGHFAKAAYRDSRTPHGFVSHVPDPSNGLCPHPGLILRLRSGNVIEIAGPARHLPPAQARDAVLASVPVEQASQVIMERCLAPAAAALHRAALAVNRTVETVCFGKPVRQPAVSILVPLYRNLDFLRFQIAAFASDPACREAEVIYVLDSPGQRAALEGLLRGFHALYGLPFTMAAMPDNLGYAAANNAAAAIARGAELLLLNSDVVPCRPGWLAGMRASLTAPGVGACGPKLLFDDDSIQHAGLYFERDASGVWYNAHYHKGMPRQWPAALTRRKVPGVTGAALLVRRPLFKAAGGICEDYIIGDYEDSDFCLRLRDAGAGIAYVPDSELYHFERRSIQLHPGYTKTLASLYNRRLHHQRWDGAMTALMARRGFRSHI